MQAIGCKSRTSLSALTKWSRSSYTKPVLRPGASPLRVLKEVFGLPSFRLNQERAIEALINGRHAFVLMATGGGKSLVYQIASLCLRGCGVVVSPLISLMEDQIAQLLLNGVKCATLNSAMELQQIVEVERQFQSGLLDILYVSPERLLTERFQALLRSSPVSLFAIDEAHCVSQWGHEFRPDYQKLCVIVASFPTVPRVALTATADLSTRQDIVTQLMLEDAVNIVTSFDRPNIYYHVEAKQGNGLKQLLAFLESHKGESGIVYCLTRKDVDKTCAKLKDFGYNAFPYHAGMSGEQKARSHEVFLLEESIIVATIAFGMGVNSPNVRFVCHLSLPRCLESYYQETGRAGRDGQPAVAWMVYSMGDVSALKANLVARRVDEDVRENNQAKVQALVEFVQETKCRRENLLKYFSDSLSSNPDFSRCCDLHDNLSKKVIVDYTEDAKKAISAVYRTGQSFGATHCIAVLMGSKLKKILSLGHEKLSVYGLGTDHSRETWSYLFHHLMAARLLEADQHGALKITDEGAKFVKEKRSFCVPKLETKSDRSKEKAESDDTVLESDKALLELLFRSRTDLARFHRLPPFFIASNETLKQIAQKKPKSLLEFRGIYGLGEKKIEQYCPAFLEICLRSHRE